MTALLGVNIDPKARPSQVAATGAQLVRCVYRDWLAIDWVQSYLNHGLEVLLVGDSSPDSLGSAEEHWGSRMLTARNRLGGLVKRWTWGNECDGTGPASWPMDHARVNRLLVAARAVFPQGEFTLSTPGFVSGDTNWPQGLRLDLVDAIDAHLYAQDIQTSAQRDNLNGIMDRYQANYGKPLWIAEFDSRTRGLAGYFRDYPGVELAAVMCWSTQMTAGEGLDLGLLQNEDAMRDFTTATLVARPTPPPAPPVAPPAPPQAPWPYYIGDSIAAAIRARGEVPIGPEVYLAGGYSVAPTEEAEYKWVAASRSVMRSPWARES